MKQVDVAQQLITVAAPASLVYKMLSTVDYECRPGSGRSVSLLGGGSTRTMAVFTTTNLQGQSLTVKEVQGLAPDRVVYSHLSGPFTGSREEIQVRGNGHSSEIELSATIFIGEDSSYRLLKLSFEHAAQEHLRDLKVAAELRVKSSGDVMENTSSIVQVPIMTTEQQLLDAVDKQEEEEWGHIGHGRGVARVAVSLAEFVVLPHRHIEGLMRAALLHDVGKIALDSSVWGVRGALTVDQREKMTEHARLGRDLAARVGLPESIQTSILHHHERWDGKGYPFGLAGDAIPLRARILAVAENVDTMMRASYRRETLSTQRVITMLEEGAAHQWDPILARQAARIIRGK
ncbi:MAG: response regulator receiver modulated metal dependent phosphohydrolase [Chloroflexi bacterium]|nr:response regulator receiver modulated metal dependent phosphohydrolase [Chloroflexota bacterium]